MDTIQKEAIVQASDFIVENLSIAEVLVKLYSRGLITNMDMATIKIKAKLHADHRAALENQAARKWAEATYHMKAAFELIRDRYEEARNAAMEQAAVSSGKADLEPNHLLNEYEKSQKLLDILQKKKNSFYDFLEILIATNMKFIAEEINEKYKAVGRARKVEITPMDVKECDKVIKRLGWKQEASAVRMGQIQKVVDPEPKEEAGGEMEL